MSNITYPVSLDHSGRRQIVIFGVTGVTGQMVLEQALTRFKGSEIAVAGRNRSKIEETMKKVELQCPSVCNVLSEVIVIEADVGRYNSLVEMCLSARLVLNCVGPFRKYGEEVVKAAIEAKTHYMDICGEPLFLESVEAKWHDVARREGVWVVGSCAFDVVPTDVGILNFKKEFPGDLTGVEAFLSLDSGRSGYVGNDATWVSAVHGFANQGELHKLRKSQEASQGSFRYVGPRLPNYGSFFKLKQFGYCVPFVGADASVVYRTQRTLALKERVDPIRFKPYLVLGSLKNLILMVIFGTIFTTFAKYQFTRNLLEKFPYFFSFGAFRKGGPTRQQMDEASFTWHFKGQGFVSSFERDSCTNDAIASSSSPSPTVQATYVFKGADAGYIGTSIMFIEAALCLLVESDDMPNEGGVYTPGIAFRDTTLVERLRNNDRFNIELNPPTATN